MTNRELVLNIFRQYGKTTAQAIQDKASDMTGTELYEVSLYIPSFAEACKKKNMLEREVGFVCISPSGRVVELIQPYDSNIYTDEPELLSAHYRFKWSQNPKYALPFVSITESYYRKGDCCIAGDGSIRRSNLDVNTWDPMEHPEYWDVVEVTE